MHLSQGYLNPVLSPYFSVFPRQTNGKKTSKASTAKEFCLTGERKVFTQLFLSSLKIILEVVVLPVDL